MSIYIQKVGKLYTNTRINFMYVGKSNKRYGGRPTVLSQQEEEIVITCQVLQEMGFGMTREMVANVGVHPGQGVAECICTWQAWR